MITLNEISASVQSGGARQTAELTARALKDKLPPPVILKEGLAAGMMETERKYRANELIYSELLIAEQAMKAGLDILMPVLEASQNPPIGTVITGTLEGDIRETEKNIISCLMKSHGLRVVDLGNSVSCKRFVEAAIEEKARIIACATGLATFLPQMKALVQAAAQSNIREKTRILLSGAPVTEWFCRSIEADMYAPDPVQAAELAADYCKKAARVSPF